MALGINYVTPPERVAVIVLNMHEGRLCRSVVGCQHLVNLVPHQFNFLQSLKNIGNLLFLCNTTGLTISGHVIWHDSSNTLPNRIICDGLYNSVVRLDPKVVTYQTYSPFSQRELDLEKALGDYDLYVIFGNCVDLDFEHLICGLLDRKKRVAIVKDLCSTYDINKSHIIEWHMPPVCIHDSMRILDMYFKCKFPNIYNIEPVSSGEMKILLGLPKIQQRTTNALSMLPAFCSDAKRIHQSA